MAHKYQLKILRNKGVEAWNAFRVQSPGKRINLSGADLSEANLSGPDLGRANLGGANLSGADLGRVNLFRANLSRANLNEANLIGSDLRGAILSKANLSKANLSMANLSGADLSSADLTGATNLEQAQIDAIDFDPASPPIIPKNLTLPIQGSLAETARKSIKSLGRISETRLFELDVDRFPEEKLKQPLNKIFPRRAVSFSARLSNDMVLSSSYFAHPHGNNPPTIEQVTEAVGMEEVETCMGGTSTKEFRAFVHRALTNMAIQAEISRDDPVINEAFNFLEDAMVVVMSSPTENYDIDKVAGAILSAAAGIAKLGVGKTMIGIFVLGTGIFVLNFAPPVGQKIGGAVGEVASAWIEHLSPADEIQKRLQKIDSQYSIDNTTKIEIESLNSVGDDAQSKIVRAFDHWWSKRGNEPSIKATGNDAFAFFSDIQTSDSELLDFKASGDKWQVIHGWLLSSDRVSD